MQSQTETLGTLPTLGEKPGLEAYKKFFVPIFALLLCSIVFHWLSGETFLTARNLSNLSRQVCVNLTLAVGMTLVILTAGIDLSVGSVLALSGMVLAMTQVHAGFAEWGFLGAVLSLIAALATGGACGWVTGLAISRFRITPFIVTLGMMVICRGLTLIISNAQAVAPIGESLGRLGSDYLPPTPSLILLAGLSLSWLLFQWPAMRRNPSWLFRTEKILVASAFFLIGAAVFGGYRGIPYMVFVAALCAALGMFVLKYLRLGRFIYAVGGNREAAELSGLPVEKTLWSTYFAMGCLAGLAGAMDVARVDGAVPSAGELAELDAIAAVVIGGTSLMGGIGSLAGTLFGVLIMGVLNNGMSLMGVSEHYQKVFKGLVIVLAVYLDLRSKKQK